MNAYARRQHFDYFRSLPYPYVGVTQNVDVTELVRFCRAEGCSFYLTILHACALAADETPEMRQRIRDGGIVQYDVCPTSHTELLSDGTYCYCTLHHHMPFAEYLRQAEAARRCCRERASIDEDDDVERMYFISTLPWLHYTALIQPVAGGDESNPRITWGKYEPDHAGRLQLPVTLLAHHALVDGLHLARFYESLKRIIAAMAGGSDVE
ncbi:MAG: chloramphenicol acetyltransferase [Clostridia bacterium]|nr:chloramphenicol acetyltransferase [Clostridia bacterium]